MYARLLEAEARHKAVYRSETSEKRYVHKSKTSGISETSGIYQQIGGISASGPRPAGSPETEIIGAIVSTVDGRH